MYENKTINQTFIFGGMNRSETSSRFRKHRHGTVTQVYDDKFVAFGHPFLADGKSTLPVYRAVTHGIVSSLAISSKSVSTYGNPIGTITKDLHPAIVGELGPGPAMIPVKVSYHPVNSTPIEKHHLVAYGQEWALSYVAAVTMDAIRMERNAATVEGTVTLHFEETETVYTEKFRTASSSPFLDVFLIGLTQIEQILDIETQKSSNFRFLTP